MILVDAIVEIKGEKYVLWHYIDAYKVNESIHATKLEDWKKLHKEYEDDMECHYSQFGGIFIYTYNDLKESIEEMREEDEYY